MYHKMLRHFFVSRVCTLLARENKKCKGEHAIGDYSCSTFKHRSDDTMIPRYRPTGELNYLHAIHAYTCINFIILTEDSDIRFSE